MAAIVDLQLACKGFECPDQGQCAKIIQQVLEAVGITDTKECTIRIVELKESSELNEQYRGKTGATNVLSFPFESPIAIDIDLLGDLVICAPLVIEQAKQQNKTVTMHWTHLIVHGCLHLLGYDHETDADVNNMEMIECEIMNKLGYSDPYKLIDLL